MGVRQNQTSDLEAFAEIYRHYGTIVAYSARRSSRDPEMIAAETMTLAWRRLEDLQGRDEALPWLITTARNLLFAEYRSHGRSQPMEPSQIERLDPRSVQPFEFESLEPEVSRALASLESIDREALLLVAWEELTPGEAAASLGMNPVAFRVRLHRARRRFIHSYSGPPIGPALSIASAQEKS